MPFPPTFTDVWDTTQPPDTQPANQLGLDIRNLKTDIMQRMSLLSGLLSNRPTPETVNATWGGSGFGLIYIATDTNQIYQWNGSSWVTIASGLTIKNFVDSTLHTPSSGDLSSVTIPGGTIGLGSIIEVIGSITHSTGSGNVDSLKVGPFLNVLSVNTSAATSGTVFRATMYADTTNTLLFQGESHNQTLSVMNGAGFNAVGVTKFALLNFANPLVIKTNTDGGSPSGNFLMVSVR
jgi:hypothetical protein